MSALEAQIMEIVARMDEGRKRRILALAQELETEPLPGETSTSETSPGTSWIDEMNAIRQQLVAKYGENFAGNVQAMLDEVREERLNDLMGGR